MSLPETINIVNQFHKQINQKAIYHILVIQLHRKIIILAKIPKK